jgi:hypothetical protein
MLIHNGVRPMGDIIQVDKGIYTEALAGGGVKFWNNKTLNSGCNGLITTIVELEGLIYCPHCDEYFNVEQFVEVENE